MNLDKKGHVLALVFLYALSAPVLGFLAYVIWSQF